MSPDIKTGTGFFFTPSVLPGSFTEHPKKQTPGYESACRYAAMMTMGSLFDGIGGFPLAAVRNGIQPLWASEIEPFPIAVTKIRFPGMLHVGDITRLNGATLPPVDVICGGSPCQDLSVAGSRAGLKGERSGLFMEQTRIAKEMRKADEQRHVPAHLVRPRYLVWENVPGAFSSAGGEDFRAVIEEIVRIKHGECDVPRSDSGRWESAGAAILGTGFSLAWRVLDAQFWGVAQRRRRIFLVADFGGTTAAEILFKQDRLPGNSAACRDPGERASPTAQRGTDDSGRACLTPWDVQSRRIFTDTGAWPALYGGEGGGHGYIKTEERPKKPLVCLNDQGGQRMEVTEEIVSTLRASMGGHQPLIFDNHGQDSRFTGPAAVSQTVSAGFGMGGNNQPLILLEDHKSDEPESGLKQKCDDSSEKTFCIAGNTIDRKPHNGGNGLGCQTDIAYTLTVADHHAVFNRQGFAAFSEGQVTGTQCARQYKGNSDLVSTYQEVVGALCSGDERGIGNQYVSQNKCILEKRNLIRRLTPMECERLQGFPDGWTLIPGASDSARYKAIGNSVAIPCVEFLMHGIAFFLSEY